MNLTQTTQLCRLVRTLCPAQAFDEFSTEGWHLILSGFAYEDAKQAVAEMASVPLEPGKARYIEPGHVIGGIRRIRAKRLEATPVPAPPPEIEGAMEQIAWQREVREQIANGTYVAPPPAALGCAPKGLTQLMIGPTVKSPVVVDKQAAELGERMTEAELNAERSRQLAALEALDAHRIADMRNTTEAETKEQQA